MKKLIGGSVDKLNFEEFNPDIGVNGYYDAIRAELFPNATPTSVDIRALDLSHRIYPKWSVFSRVRKIDESQLSKFKNEKISPNEFLPPKQSVAQVPIGRFNKQGERKLYLADHPYIAMRECGIEPGDYFLINHFSFNIDMHLIEVNSDGSKLCKMLNSLLQSKDSRFYEVINLIYENFLNYEYFDGITYESVKVNKGYQHHLWGEVKSNTNLAMKEKNISSTNLVVGWLALCDNNYNPEKLRIFRPLSPKKSNKLVSFSRHENESKFTFEDQLATNEVNRLVRKSIIRIQRGDCIYPTLSPIKFSFKK